MIKLIDDLSLLERLSEKEPYFGSLFNAAAVSFMDDPELLSIWVEIDEHGDAYSFLNASTDSMMLFSPYGIPGFEMILFVTNLVSGGTRKHIDCDENSYSVLRNLVDFETVEMLKRSTLYNNIFEGYKLYVPRGLKVIDKNKYNAEILHNDNIFYLYVDIVSYHYKVKKDFVKSNSNILSSILRVNGKVGYIDITEIDNRYFVEFMYNYAKIESFVKKDELNEAVLNMVYILSSIQFNDKVIDTLIGENALDYKEENFDIFESKKENSKFLEYIEKYNNSDYEEENKDQDILDYETLE